MSPSGSSLTANAPQILLPKASTFLIHDGVFSHTARLKPLRRRRLCLRVSCTSENSGATASSSQYASQFGDLASETQRGIESLSFEVRSPSSPPSLIPRPTLSLSDQAFFLLAFIGCTVIYLRLRKSISFPIFLTRYCDPFFFFFYFKFWLIRFLALFYI